jgi:hypothetical protein
MCGKVGMHLSMTDQIDSQYAQTGFTANYAQLNAYTTVVGSRRCAIQAAAGTHANAAAVPANHKRRCEARDDAGPSDAHCEGSERFGYDDSETAVRSHAHPQHAFEAEAKHSDVENQSDLILLRIARSLLFDAERPASL